MKKIIVVFLFVFAGVSSFAYNRSQYNMLKNQGVFAWNNWRAQNPNAVIDLSNAKLKNINLKKANLSKANLKKAYFYKADLTEAILDDANLERAKFHYVTLDNTSLKNIKANRIYLYHAKVNVCTFSGGDFSYALFRFVRFRFSKFYKTNLQHARFEAANRFTEFEFIKADMKWISMKGQLLMKVQFAGCTMTKGNFTRAKLDDASFIKHRGIGNEITNAIFKDARLIHTRLTDANGTKANFSGADFNRTILKGFNNRFGTFLGVKNLTKARLDGVVFYKALINKISPDGINQYNFFRRRVDAWGRGFTIRSFNTIRWR